jgi:predicted nucleic acid-binding protein
LVFVDSNVFIIDRFYPRDALYSQNRSFIEKLPSIDAAISILTLLEVCGGASHRLSARELDDWLFRFDTIYPVHVINVHGISQKDAEAWWRDFVREVTAAIAKKMSFGDALLLREAENYNAEAIVTWNTKDFSRRTRLAVLTPTGFLRQH